tara:strand:+ start:435 stop:569 length:135 start_codon:yes stop_codon:yes gene_type:complete
MYLLQKKIITYLSLLLIFFLAATILPLSSELVLVGLLNTSEHNP